MRNHRIIALAVAASVVLALAACSHSDSSSWNPNRNATPGGQPQLPGTWGSIVPATDEPGTDVATGVSVSNHNSAARIAVGTINLGPGAGGTAPVALDIALTNQLPVPTPAVANGRIYVGNGFGSYTMNCLDLQTGAVIWSKPTQSDGPSAVATDGNYVVFTTESCTVEVMDAATGNLRWARWLGDPVPAMPALVGNRVLAIYPDWGGYGQPEPMDGPIPYGQVAVGSPGSSGSGFAIASFNVTDGACNWVAPLPEHAITAPVVHGNDVFVTTLDGGLTRIHLETGAVLAQTQLFTTSAPTVYADGGTYKLAFSQRQGTSAVECLRTSSLSGVLDSAIIAPGAANYLQQSVVDAGGHFGVNVQAVMGTEFSPWLLPSWNTGAYPNVGVNSVFAMSCFEGSRPVVSEGNIYAAMGNRVVAATLDGTQLWAYDHAPGTAWRVLNAPVLVSDKLVFTDLDGKVVILDRATGNVVHSWTTGYRFTHQPAVVDGNIVVGSSNGHVLVIPTGDAAMDGWSQWGGSATNNK